MHCREVCLSFCSGKRFEIEPRDRLEIELDLARSRLPARDRRDRFEIMETSGEEEGTVENENTEANHSSIQIVEVLVTFLHSEAQNDQ